MIICGWNWVPAQVAFDTMWMLCWPILTALGLAFTLESLFRVLYDVWTRFSRPWQNLKTFGKWAVVTGATDGIGKQMALLLAKHGLSVFLISRDDTKLSETAKEVKEQLHSGESVRTLAIDFADPNRDALVAALESLDIGILVNNVGLSYPSAQFYGELDYKFIDSLINVNIRATFQMTRIVYPGMSKRRRGVICCVGSGASELPTEPLYAAYAGVKGGIECFCRSLQVEASESEVIVQCHVPLLVSSKLSRIRNPSTTAPSAKAYAIDAVRCIAQGSPLDHPTKSPYFVHTLMFAAIRLLPRQVWNRIRLEMTKKLRIAFMRKQQKDN